MMKEPNYSICALKWRANRNLSTKEGYQPYEIDFKNKCLVPFPNTKLDIKRKFVEPIIKKHVIGKSVIDLGCDKGYFSWFSMISGADKVLANDVNFRLHSYLILLCKSMGWGKIEPINDNLFIKEETIKADYVLSLAMLHQVREITHEQAVGKIRQMCKFGALIEFCEDYQQEFGMGWNKNWFENLLKINFADIKLIGCYDAITEKGGIRYLYDCRCN